jgi:RNA polymerase sigma-70 factor (ECF subfamily)
MKKHSQISDEQLVSLAQQQLPYITLAYEELVGRYQTVILRFCSRFLGSATMGEDCLQEILIKVFHHLGDFKGNSSFKTWIFTISRHQCLDLLRANKKHRENLLDNNADDVLLGSLIAAEPITPVDAMDHLLQDLSELDREILLLKYVSGHTLQEISDITNLKLSATKMRCKRALEKLKSSINEFQ